MFWSSTLRARTIVLSLLLVWLSQVHASEPGAESRAIFAFTLTAGGTFNRTVNAAPINSTIATGTNFQPFALTVTQIAPFPPGITVANIVGIGTSPYTVTADLSCTSAALAGPNTITLFATGSDGITKTATFTVNVILGTPAITPAPALTRTQGQSAVSTIATVSDTVDAAGTLTVTTLALPAGISVTGIVNTAGTISATVAASSSAVIGPNTVMLQVTNSSGATAIANLTVNVGPSLIIISPPNAMPPTGTTGQTVTFSGAALPPNITWDFGDGATGNGSTVSHVFAAPGAYTVKMTVVDPSSGQSLSATLQYTVSPPQFRVRLAKFKLGGSSDTTELMGILHVPQDSKLAGQKVILSIGGNTRTFVLDSRGHARSGRDTFTLALVTENGKVTEQECPFKAAISGALAAALKANAPLDASGFPTSVSIQIQLGTNYFTSSINVKFSSGRAKFGFF